MKKLLLTTTAIGLVASAPALAEGPKVTIGGYADFQYGVTGQDSQYENNVNVFSSDTHTRTDTELYVSVDGKADNGLAYGAYIELEADTSTDDASLESNDVANNAERTFIYLESGLGRVELGANGDAGDALRVDAASFARATGGVGGDFYNFIDLGGDASGTADNAFKVIPGLPTAALPGEAFAGDNTLRATANKISYYTPRISGLQAGISYTPNQGERGMTSGFAGDFQTAQTGINAVNFLDVINAGINYQGEIEGIGIEAAITGEQGDAPDQNATTASANDDLEAYSAGLALSFAGFTVGGSIAKIDEYGRQTTLNSEAEYWTAGVAYEFGPFAASVTYLESEVENDVAGQDAEFENLSIGADYQLAPGLVPYVEVSFVETDDGNNADIDNDGTVFLVGTELSF